MDFTYMDSADPLKPVFDVSVKFFYTSANNLFLSFVHSFNCWYANTKLQTQLSTASKDKKKCPPKCFLQMAVWIKETPSKFYQRGKFWRGQTRIVKKLNPFLISRAISVREGCRTKLLRILLWDFSVPRGNQIYWIFNAPNHICDIKIKG